jgi:outer membrane protein OmpA-like peptidoglycan-associated protein
VKLLTPEIKLDETERGLKLTFASKVLFDFDKTDIKESADKVLKEAVRILNSYVKQNISVEGHTDSYGSDDYNQRLSERRAEAVADYLIREGVDKNRITTVGFGEKNPVATNKTSAGREQNRRVEILILKEDQERQIL